MYSYVFYENPSGRHYMKLIAQPVSFGTGGTAAQRARWALTHGKERSRRGCWRAKAQDESTKQAAMDEERPSKRPAYGPLCGGEVENLLDDWPGERKPAPTPTKTSAPQRRSWNRPSLFCSFATGLQDHAHTLTAKLYALRRKASNESRKRKTRDDTDSAWPTMPYPERVCLKRKACDESEGQASRKEPKLDGYQQCQAEEREEEELKVVRKEEGEREEEEGQYRYWRHHQQEQLQLVFVVDEVEEAHPSLHRHHCQTGRNGRPEPLNKKILCARLGYIHAKLRKIQRGENKKPWARLLKSAEKRWVAHVNRLAPAVAAEPAPELAKIEMLPPPSHDAASAISPKRASKADVKSNVEAPIFPAAPATSSPRDKLRSVKFAPLETAAPSKKRPAEATEEAPRAKKIKFFPRGLSNGSRRSCFLNSMVQCVSEALKPRCMLKRKILAHKIRASEVQPVSENGNFSGNLAELISSLTSDSSNTSTADPSRLEAAFNHMVKQRVPDYDAHAQQDVGEALSHSFEQWAQDEFLDGDQEIASSLGETPEPLLGELYKIDIAVTRTCLGCEHTYKTTPENSWTLDCTTTTQPIQELIEGALQANLLQGFKCPQCGDKSMAEYREIAKAREWMVVQLGYNYDSQTGNAITPTIGGLSKEVELWTTENGGGKTRYQLRAMAMHQQGLSSYAGHYWSVAKRDGQWFKFDDERVTEVTEHFVVQQAHKTAHPKLLFFHRV